MTISSGAALLIFMMVINLAFAAAVIYSYDGIHDILERRRQR